MRAGLPPHPVLQMSRRSLGGGAQALRTSPQRRAAPPAGPGAWQQRLPQRCPCCWSEGCEAQAAAAAPLPPQPQLAQAWLAALPRSRAWLRGAAAWAWASACTGHPPGLPPRRPLWLAHCTGSKERGSRGAARCKPKLLCMEVKSDQKPAGHSTPARHAAHVTPVASVAGVCDTPATSSAAGVTAEQDGGRAGLRCCICWRAAAGVASTAAAGLVTGSAAPLACVWQAAAAGMAASVARSAPAAAATGLGCCC
jgi:hypothetical protein